MSLFNRLLLITASLLLSSTASASTNCDCSKILDQCGASISSIGPEIQIMTNTKRCASVTWYADVEAHNTVVTNGKLREPSEFKSKPFLYIGSCDICANAHPHAVKVNNVTEESAECKKRKANLKMSEKFYTEGRITPYEFKLSQDLVKQHCN
jgi:hypothetical protein